MGKVEIKDVVGFENLFGITSSGEVWSKRTNKFLVQGISKTGYPVLSTRIGGRDGKCYCFKVHKFVADAFVPNPENKPFVNHKDGDKRNNNSWNLEWVTASENTIHAYENGLAYALKGIENPSSIFTKSEVIFIRENYKPRDKTFGARALSRKYGTCHQVILKIVNNITYKNV